MLTRATLAGLVFLPASLLAWLPDWTVVSHSWRPAPFQCEEYPSLAAQDAIATLRPGAGGATLPDDIRDMLRVTVSCQHARYDTATEQARWTYQVELRHNVSARYAVHLTRLTRRVINDFEHAEGAAVGGVQSFTLDTLRSALHIHAGGGISFPCAETIGAPGRATVRARSGTYTVERTYEGDVTIEDPRTHRLRFIPVEVVLDIQFDRPRALATTSEGRPSTRAARRVEWGLVSSRCDICRPVLICESLADAPAAPSPPPYPARRGSEIHVSIGLEKRAVAVDGRLADDLRTISCARWIPPTGAPGPADLQIEDRTEQGLPAATPYLTFHHMRPAASLAPGLWTVETRVVDVLDTREAGQPDPARLCPEGRPAFSRQIRVQ